MFQWARNLVGLGVAPRPSAAAPSIIARYDNATTTEENQRNWWASDYLSAKASNSFQVRRVLRMRSRYEVSNNPYLMGITANNADDLISTGPTLQVQTGKEKYDRDVEKKFAAWAHEVDLAEKLRTAKLAKTIDGEGFLVLKTCDDLDSPVKLYPCDIEADQVTTPMPQTSLEYWVDGVILHPVTNRPVKYNVLRHHPGDFFFQDLNPLRFDSIPAEYVIHWFPKFRPGQVRGIPVYTPSLDLATELRAYRKAVLGAAEIAADYAAVFTSTLAPANIGDDNAEAGYTPFQRVHLSRKMGVFMPIGVDVKQLDPKQPTTTYEMFQEKCLAEAVRPLAYPLNLALGSSQKFNFSSAKLDHINYRESLTVERKQCERVVLHKIFAAWCQEAILAGAIEAYDGVKPPPHAWHWPGFTSLDPMVDAESDALRIANGQLTLQQFWAERGKEWREVLKQLSIEMKEIEGLGLEFGDVIKRTITETTDDPAEVANAA